MCACGGIIIRENIRFFVCAAVHFVIYNQYSKWKGVKNSISTKWKWIIVKSSTHIHKFIHNKRILIKWGKRLRERERLRIYSIELTEKKLQIDKKTPIGFEWKYVRIVYKQYNIYMHTVVWALNVTDLS